MKKLILLSILLSGYLTGWGQSADENKADVFISDPTIMPAYPGGETEMYKFINERLFYPWAGDSIKGRVIVRFRVDTLGDLRDVVVLRGINAIADSISISIVRQMPRWSIGTRYGKTLDILFTLPIVFDPEKIPAEKKLSMDCQMACYPGGEEAMYKFLLENMRYPYFGKSVSIKFFIKFIVDKNGKIWHPYVVESLHTEIDAEVLRVMSMMPKWIVAQNNIGCYLYTLPIIVDL